MIEVVLNGRLGNWLFQYAAARALALQTASGVRLNLTRYVSWHDPGARRVTSALSFFRLNTTYTQLPISYRRVFEKVRSTPPRSEFSEAGFGYDPRFRSLGRNTTLLGYFQSPRYWADNERSISDELSPRALPRDPAIEQVLTAVTASESVSVHVRRGDYLTTERALHGVCTVDYYARTVDHFRKQLRAPTFFIFSDDIAWCRTHFRDSDMVPVDVSLREAPAALDLYLMSRCRHHVISNSSYGWWGAWLNPAADKIVCAPERWFNDAAMNEQAMRDTVPGAWLRMPCHGQTLPL